MWRGALAVDMSAPRLAFWGAVRSYLRGGTVSSCQRRLDGVFLSGSVMCALCGLAAEVCKAPCAPATRARRFCAAGARPISGQRTRFDETSAPARSSLGQQRSPRSVILSVMDAVAHSPGARFKELSLKIDLRDTLASSKRVFRIRPLAHKVSLEAFGKLQRGRRGHLAQYVGREDASTSVMRS